MTFPSLASRLASSKSKGERYLDPETRLSFDVAQMIIEARAVKGLTQKDLAKKMGTKQSAIARAERGQRLPSLSFLDKMAQSFGSYLLPPRFGFLNDYDPKANRQAKVDCIDFDMTGAYWLSFSGRASSVSDASVKKTHVSLDSNLSEIFDGARVNTVS